MTRDQREQPSPAGQTSAGNEMLQLETFNDNGTTTVVVRGEIDMLTATLLEAALADIPTGRALLVDMAGVGFMDSSGLKVVMTESHRRRGAGGSLRVVNESMVVTRLLEISGLGFLAKLST